VFPGLRVVLAPPPGDQGTPSCARPRCAKVLSDGDCPVRGAGTATQLDGPTRGEPGRRSRTTERPPRGEPGRTFCVKCPVQSMARRYHVSFIWANPPVGLFKRCGPNLRQRRDHSSCWRSRSSRNCSRRWLRFHRYRPPGVIIAGLSRPSAAHRDRVRREMPRCRAASAVVSSASGPDMIGTVSA